MKKSSAGSSGIASALSISLTFRTNDEHAPAGGGMRAFAGLRAGRPSPSYIGVQTHTGHVSFRNIRIRAR